METPVLPKRAYRFGLFQIDPETGKLLRQGMPVKLHEQSLRVLCLLLDRAGNIVSREELRQSLWPEGTYVEFEGSLNAILKRLRFALGDDADNPIFIETLPKRGYRFIAPVAVDTQRPASETQEAIIKPRTPPQASAAEAAAVALPSPTGRRRHLIYVVTLVAALLAVFGWYSSRLQLRPSVVPSFTAAPLPVRKSVAVLGFRNASGRSEDDWLATALAEMLSTELAVGEKLRLVPAEEVANLRLSSPWPQTSTLGRETTARIGTALNSDVLVLGSYTVIGRPGHSELRFDVRLQDARTGDLLTQVAQTGNANDLFRFSSEIGARLRQRLGVPEIRDTEQAGVLASLPLDRDGARFYALGVAELREFDALAGKDLLEQAVKADPKFALAHLALGGAWGMLGYEQKHRDEVRKALELSMDLPRVERMQVEGDYYASLPDREKAASTYRAMFELFPDNVEYGLQLAYAQNAAGHGSQALETIARLRRLPALASDDPRIDLAQARILPSNRQDEALALRHTAAAKASAQGKKLVYALARLGECVGLVYGEHPEQSDAPCHEAYNVYLAAGNRLLAADALRMLADKEGGDGHLTQAIATYQRALKTLSGSGEQLKTAIILNNMAIAYSEEGHLDRSEQLYRQAKFHFEQGGDKGNAMESLTGIADILYLRGNLSAAARTYAQVIDTNTAAERGDPGYGLFRLADLELARGHVQDAHRLATQAFESARLRKTNLAETADELGNVLKAEGDLQGARQQFQAALDIYQAKGHALAIARTQTSLAELALEEGGPDQAEPLLRASIAEFDKEKADPDAASSYIALSRTLLMENRLEDAAKAIQRAAELSRTSPDPALKLPIQVQTARVMLAAAGQKDRSQPSLSAVRRQLRSATETAQRLGYYGEECESRLALGELEAKTDPALARLTWTRLATEAHQHGMELIARKASALSAGSTGTAMTVAPIPPH